MKKRKPEILASYFLEVIPKAMREIRLELRSNRQYGLSVPQFRILAHLWSKGSTNNKRLAEDLGVSVAAMSRMIQYLVERDLVSRKGGHDRREVQIELSKNGHRIYEGIRSKTRARMAAKFDQLSLQEQNALELGFEVLRRVVIGESDK